MPAGHTPASWLRALTEQGALRRFPVGVPPAVRQTLEHELALISQLGFEPYFLTVADIVRWARDEQGILCQGRGSAANSAVCYCLGITRRLGQHRTADCFPSAWSCGIDPSAKYAAVNSAPRSGRSHIHRGPQRCAHSSGHTEVGGPQSD